MSDTKTPLILSREQIEELREHGADVSLCNQAIAAIALQTRAEMWHRVVKDIYEEWNEACDEKCDSYGHTETCKATNIAQAKHALRERAEQAEARAHDRENMWHACERKLEQAESALLSLGAEHGDWLLRVEAAERKLAEVRAATIEVNATFEQWMDRRFPNWRTWKYNGMERGDPLASPSAVMMREAWQAAQSALPHTPPPESTLSEEEINKLVYQHMSGGFGCTSTEYAAAGQLVREALARVQK